MWKKFDEILGRLFDNPKPARYIILGFVILLVLFLVNEAKADTTIELGAPAISYNFTSANGPIFILSERWEKWNVGFGLVGQQDDKYDRTISNNIFIHGQRTVRGWGWADDLILGVGLAYFNNTSVDMGSHLNFSLSLEYNKRRKSWLPDYAVIRHFSSAGSKSPNAGQDALLIGWYF